MKSKVAAGVLGIVLGGFGVHRFYLGQVGLGILYLLFFWTGIPWIVGWVDGIIMLTADEDVFNFKYNKEYYYSNQNRNQRPNHGRPESRASYNKYQEREDERQRQRERQQQRTTPKRNNPYKDEGTRLYREYDFRGAIKSYQMALKVSPNDAIVHFNLACLYSLEEDKKHSYLHLSKAVENGFAMYDKIREHDHLAFLRTDPSFETFVANGYKTHAAYDRPMSMQALPPRENDEIDLMSDEVMKKLEQLGKLKDSGFLTEEEFRAQKVQLLKKR